MLKIFKWIGLSLLGLVIMIALAVTVSSFTTKLPGEKATPSGLPRNQALYVEMRDGVRIAIDVWLPEDYEAGDALPTMLYMTRYWRAQEVGPLQRGLIGLGIAPTGDLPIFPARAFNAAGYAFIQVDARGSGASFGSRPIEFSPDEVADYGELAEWITNQDWSNGAVGAIGISYNGNTAELLASTGHPAVRAVAPLYSDFDPQYGLVQPGGAFNAYLDHWGRTVGLQDENNVCALMDMSGVLCWALKLWAPGVKPVDADTDGALLAAAVAAHRKNTPVAEGFSKVEYRDDVFGDGPYGIGDTAPYALKDRIEASNVPMHLWVGWLDAATVEGALARYQTFSNQQELIIGPYSHGGFADTDPFADPALPPSPSTPDQWKEMIAFFDRELAEPAPTGAANSIRYYTLGSGEWRTTDVWPPAGLEDRTFYFGADGALVETAPADAEAFDPYTVDFDVTTGEHTRWHTNMGLGDVVYPERSEMDARMLVYTSAPLPADLEITGAPVIDLHVASTSADGVFHAYLEAVSPEGEVTYVTEGVLRAIHRKISDGEPPYAQQGPYHTFLRADAEPMVPGEVAQVPFHLYPTSVLIPEGWRVRIALAGADASMFKPWPADETPEWRVQRTAEHPSRVVLPSRWRD